MKNVGVIKKLNTINVIDAQEEGKLIYINIYL